MDAQKDKDSLISMDVSKINENASVSEASYTKEITFQQDNQDSSPSCTRPNRDSTEHILATNVDTNDNLNVNVSIADVIKPIELSNDGKESTECTKTIECNHSKDRDSLVPGETKNLMPGETEDLVPSETKDLVPSETKDMVPHDTQDLVSAKTKDLVPNKITGLKPGDTKDLISGDTKSCVPVQTKGLSDLIFVNDHYRDAVTIPEPLSDTDNDVPNVYDSNLELFSVDLSKELSDVGRYAYCGLVAHALYALYQYSACHK